MNKDGAMNDTPDDEAKPDVPQSWELYQAITDWQKHTHARWMDNFKSFSAASTFFATAATAVVAYVVKESKPVQAATETAQGVIKSAPIVTETCQAIYANGLLIGATVMILGLIGAAIAFFGMVVLGRVNLVGALNYSQLKRMEYHWGRLPRPILEGEEVVDRHLLSAFTAYRCIHASIYMFCTILVGVGIYIACNGLTSPHFESAHKLVIVGSMIILAMLFIFGFGWGTLANKAAARKARAMEAEAATEAEAKAKEYAEEKKAAAIKARQLAEKATSEEAEAIAKEAEAAASEARSTAKAVEAAAKKAKDKKVAAKEIGRVERWWMATRQKLANKKTAVEKEEGEEG